MPSTTRSKALKNELLAANKAKAIRSQKKRRKSRDPLYTPKSRHAKSAAAMEASLANVMNMRSQHSAEPTSAMLCGANLSSPEVKAFNQRCGLFKSHRPINRVTKWTLNNSPLVIQTPGGTEHTRIDKMAYMVVFRKNAVEGELVSPVTEVAANHSAFDTPLYKSIKPNQQKIKYQSIHVTPELLKKTRSEIAVNQGRRSQSQNKVAVKEGVPEAKGSATGYAQLFDELPADQRYEWLHLVAHFVKGKKSQDIDNLGIGTAHANTKMLFVEAQIPLLARFFPEGFRIDVEAEYMENTQIMSSIIYKISTKSFNLVFEFNAQDTIRPEIMMKEYLRTLVEVKIDSPLSVVKRSLFQSTPDTAIQKDLKMEMDSAYVLHSK